MYDYRKAIRNDVLQFLANEEIGLDDFRTADGEIDYEALEDELLNNGGLEEACTGGLDGVYNMEANMADARILDAVEDGLIAEMATEYSMRSLSDEYSAVKLDVMLRGYLFSEVVSDVISELSYTFGDNLDFASEEFSDLMTDEEPATLEGQPNYDLEADLEDEIRQMIEDEVSENSFFDCENRNELKEKLYEIASEQMDLDNGYNGHNAFVEMAGNVDLFLEAAYQLGYDLNQTVEESESMLSTVLHYLLPDVIEEVVDDLGEDYFHQNEKDTEQTQDKASSGLNTRIAAAQHACQQADEKDSQTKEKGNER